MRWGQRRQDLIRVFTGSLWLLWEGDGGVEPTGRGKPEAYCEGGTTKHRTDGTRRLNWWRGRGMAWA